jgi:hypothetical protein
MSTFSLGSRLRGQGNKAELTEVAGMNRFATFGSIWCLSLLLSPALQAGKDLRSSDPTSTLQEIVDVLRAAWGQDFESNYRRYMLGTAPTVLLIPRAEMRKIAAARLDGRRRDGETTQGLTIKEKQSVRIVVVYDDLAPFLVAKTIIHEVGHLELSDKRLSRNAEEARVRKIVDTGFFEKVFGREWVEITVAALREKVHPVEKGGRLYQGHTPEAVELLYQRMRKTGLKLDKTPLHDQILANMVFILTNTEESLSAALDFEDAQN